MPVSLSRLAVLGRLLPHSPWHAFRTTVLVSLFGSFLLLGVIGPLFGISQQYGGSPHDGYLEIAQTLVSHGRYALEPDGPVVLHRPPAVPFLLYAIHSLFGSSRYFLCAAHSLFAGMLAALMFAHTRSCLGLETARLTTPVFLLYPWLYWHVKNPMTPMLVATFAWLLVYTWATADRRGRARDWLLTGVSGGFLALTHGGTLLFLPAVVVAGVLYSLRRGAAMRALHLALVLVAFVATIAPWTYRNYQHTGRIIPVATNAGYAYFWALTDLDSFVEAPTVPLTDRIFARAGLDSPPPGFVQAHGIPDPEIDAAFNAKMLHHVLDHPGELFAKIVVHGTWFWFPLRLSVESALLWIAHGCLLVLAALGGFRSYAEGRFPGMNVAYAFYAWGIHSFFVASVGHAQYSFASFTLILPLAVFGFLRWRSTDERREARTLRGRESAPAQDPSRRRTRSLDSGVAVVPET
jgi:4-amino-4-deoxy-L-arabinose transferase-like glycosyltransferase